MDNANVKNIFQERFKELVGDTATQEEIANRVNTSRQNVGNWLNGKSKPDIYALAEIAKGYSVSVDWLLGLTNVKSNDITIKNICEYTGLTEKAIGRISILFQEGAVLQINALSSLVEEPEIISILFDIVDYCYIKQNLAPNMNFYDEFTSAIFDEFCEYFKGALDFDRAIENILKNGTLRTLFSMDSDKLLELRLSTIKNTCNILLDKTVEKMTKQIKSSSDKD